MVIKCSPRVYKKCPDRKYCGSVQEACFVEGSECDKFQQKILQKISGGTAKNADLVRVVRCKDCKHFTEGMAVGMCKVNPEKPVMPLPYRHYCSYGKRRGG